MSKCSLAVSLAQGAIGDNARGAYQQYVVLEADVSAKVRACSFGDHIFITLPSTDT